MIYNRKKSNRDIPITSFGLILFYKEPDKEIKFVVQQRRDTFEYMDLIRGLWRSDFQIKSLLSRMTPEERDRILHNTFQDLWDDLFIQTGSKIYTDLLPKSKRKYAYIERNKKDFISTTITTTTMQPWGFPKGKKMSQEESDIECAIRETEEETRIPRLLFTVYPDLEFVEEFSGSNAKNYATHYYLAEMNCMYKPDRLKTPHCIRVDTLSDEVHDFEYFNFDDACKVLNERRRKLLLNAFNTIKYNFK